ncbi:hypothetical protein GQ651_01600 [Alphaproteobacteria bacterium GH1-50]|uniref:Esterase n=1 Tax=Kangsaoukella pontilimi TaxID=2691042 RepID=A0A7C9M899_9RHOB|nr:hypothetical protein [Kangsaoukella pontilimi]MXQ06533.1 hypothetical protein [Kangsaoukella pontilimi]
MLVDRGNVIAEKSACRIGQGSRQSAALQIVYEEWPLRVWYSSAGSADSRALAVSFSSIGHVHEEYPPPEFVGTCQAVAGHVLYVSDISRSWLNAHDLHGRVQAIIERFQQELRTDRLFFIGTSMGAFSAVVMSQLMTVDKVLSFSPQYSPMYRHVPEERRWRRYRKLLRNHKFPTICINSSRAADLLVLHGGTDDELVHAKRLDARRAGVVHIELQLYNHNLAAQLKAEGILLPLATAFFGADNQKYLELVPRPYSILSASPNDL